MKEPQKKKLVKSTKPSKKDQTPVTVTITLLMLLILGIVWLVYSLYMAVYPDPSFAQLGAYRWIIAANTFVPGLVCLVLWFLLRKKWKPGWYLALVGLAIITIYNIIGQVGWVDWLFIVGTAIPVVLLIIDRKWYLKA